MINSCFNGIKFKPFVLVMVFAACLFLTSCDSSVSHIDRVYFDFFGSTVFVGIYANNVYFWQKNNLDKHFRMIEDDLNYISGIFSVDDPDSEISKFNGLKYGECFEGSDLFIQMLIEAIELSNETDGFFNPAVKPLVDLWGFSKIYSKNDYMPIKPYDRPRNNDGSFDLPKQKYIDAFKNLTDLSKIKIEGNVITKECPFQMVDGDNVVYEQQLDLSAIIKGAMAERISSILEKSYNRYYVDVGSSSFYFSSQQDLEITDPFNIDSAIGKISVNDINLSTSGTYRNCYTFQGVNYHHIIDPTTGAPAITDIVSITIIGSDGARCEAYSTASLMFGIDETIIILETLQYNYFIVDNNGVIYTNAKTI